MLGISKLKLIEIANRVPLFKALDTHEKEQVISIPNIVKVINKGERFISYGEHNDNFFILLSGKASIYQKEQKIAVVEGGQFVGEVGFICATARTANAIAETDLITFCIDKKSFLMLPALLREKIKDKLITGLVERIEHMNIYINHLTTQVDILLPTENEKEEIADSVSETDHIDISEFISMEDKKSSLGQSMGSPWYEDITKK